jgi:signal transduction histidine kinase
MRLRAEAIEAELFVRSAPRRGTTVIVVLRS